MKVLAIMGSPKKKGNTFRVVERVKEQLIKMDGSIVFEFLFLKDCDIKMCTGCFTCFAQGEDRCPLKDDLSMIKQKMQAADGILFAAPTYAMGVPGIMKNFIDRMAYTLHRPCFYDKAFMAVSTVGGIMGMKQALEQLALLSAGGKKTIKLGVPMPPIAMRGLKKKAQKSVQKAAKAFYGAMQNQKRKAPGLGDWAYFHAFKKMTAFDSYKTACPADYAYYQQRSEYFYAIKGHYLRRVLGRVFGGLMGFGIKLMVLKESKTAKEIPAAGVDAN